MDGDMCWLHGKGSSQEHCGATGKANAQHMSCGGCPGTMVRTRNDSCNINGRTNDNVLARTLLSKVGNVPHCPQQQCPSDNVPAWYQSAPAEYARSCRHKKASNRGLLGLGLSTNKSKATLSNRVLTGLGGRTRNADINVISAFSAQGGNGGGGPPDTKPDDNVQVKPALDDDDGLEASAARAWT